MGLQRARQESEIEDRQNDIIKCCDKIYTSSFFNMDAVTIQAISKLSKIARSSIYTYYATKEEILLDLLGQEYIFLAEDLSKEFKNKISLSRKDYVKILATCFCRHEKFFRLASVRFTNLEPNSSIDKISDLLECQKHYDVLLKSSIIKYFPTISVDSINEFSLNIHAYLNGIYPYLNPTPNQIKALKISMPNYKIPNFFKTIYNIILQFFEKS